MRYLVKGKIAIILLVFVFIGLSMLIGCSKYNSDRSDVNKPDNIDPQPKTSKEEGDKAENKAGVVDDSKNEVVVIDDNKNNLLKDDEKSVSKSREAEKTNEDLVSYNGVVQHIFFHPLIAYPELAFDGDYKERGYNDYFVTVKEFNRILDKLYEKNFILININDTLEEIDENGTKFVKKKELMLPKGKQPLVISIDDMNYYKYMIQNGNVHRLILDGDGNVATFSISPTGRKVIAYDNEIVPILDKFVEEHPDFSLNGAKGVIALTGFEGVLGYRTQNIYAAIYEQERADALRVIKRLKETGWTFACHGYGHRDAAKVSVDKLKSDTQKWRKEVGELVGPTSIYIYPYGSRVLPGDKRFDVLVNEGFNILCAVGPRAYEKCTKKAIMLDRRHMDGIAFLQQRHLLLDLFDSNDIIDHVRPVFRKKNN